MNENKNTKGFSWYIIMGREEVFFLIFGIIIVSLMEQNIAAGNIGNRSYSLWYETHFLIKKQGICKLIYFRPKHFGRYTLYEVISFFVSFLSPMIFGFLTIFVCTNILPSIIFNTLIVSYFGLFLISQIIVVAINDIGSHTDEKKRFYFESGESLINDNSFFTIYNLWDSYHKRINNAKTSIEKIEKINMEYIEYFKKIDKLVVIKENKDGTLILKKDSK